MKFDGWPKTKGLPSSTFNRFSVLWTMKMLAESLTSNGKTVITLKMNAWRRSWTSHWRIQSLWLTPNDIQQLAARAKTIVMRKAQSETILKQLQARLKGLKYANDICNRTWHSWSWSYKFTETSVQKILFEPLLSSADMTDENLNDLEQQLRQMMETMDVQGGGDD